MNESAQASPYFVLIVTTRECANDKGLSTRKQMRNAHKPAQQSQRKCAGAGLATHRLQHPH